MRGTPLSLTSLATPSFAWRHLNNGAPSANYCFLGFFFSSVRGSSKKIISGLEFFKRRLLRCLRAAFSPYSRSNWDARGKEWGATKWKGGSKGDALLVSLSGRIHHERRLSTRMLKTWNRSPLPGWGSRTGENCDNVVVRGRRGGDIPEQGCGNGEYWKRTDIDV